LAADRPARFVLVTDVFCPSLSFNLCRVAYQWQRNKPLGSQ
jgi:hypothetical protein